MNILKSSGGLCVYVLLLCLAPAVSAQMETASLSGRVTDPNGAVVPHALIEAIENNTNVKTKTETNGDGLYYLSSLRPGNYRVVVSKDGFRQVIQAEVVLHVQDVLTLNFGLQIGSVNETVNVTGGAPPLINTQDAAVSTVVDRQFAENLPLNGRSFQTLIQLTPGVVLTAVNSGDTGQFNVNGQRATSNYWVVDGVSANIGMGATATPGQGLSGALGSFSVLGGTNSLVSVDALQEFRIQTSTFAPEFGRTPGAQISIVTRSGANTFHGSVFDYLRNDALDANNWFNSSVTPALPKAKERQNDFGGTFSGPILKDKTFFFFSYEGLRLRLPQTELTYVPCDGTCQAFGNARAMAVAQMQPFLNAYSLPNGPEQFAQCDPSTDPSCPPSGKKSTGYAQFNKSFSNPATLDAYSLRIDHKLNDKLNVFGRYNYSPSEIDQRGNSGSSLSTVSPARITIQTGTAGMTWSISPVVTNDFRFNYSSTDSSLSISQDNFGGAVPVNSFPFPSGSSTHNAAFGVIIFSLGFSTGAPLSAGQNAHNLLRQINLVDSMVVQRGTHDLKFGVDFRRLSPRLSIRQYVQTGLFFSVSQAETGNTFLTVLSSAREVPLEFRNLGVFAQDTWRTSPRLTLTYGLRWDVDVAPNTTGGPSFPAVTGFNLSNLSNLAPAPAGTPAFKTTYDNVAPRLGVAYQLSQKQDRQTVFRGGLGLFYDLATTETGNLVPLTFYPFGTLNTVPGASFPLTGAAGAPPPIVPAAPGTGQIFAFDPNLRLPYTLEWNVALEQALGRQQTISATYIGSIGRRLTETAQISAPNPNLQSAVLVTNGGTSDYSALQLQFQRRLSRGLQTLASYTWAHSIDTASASSFGSGSNELTQLNPNVNRGPSDFDIRNAFSLGLTYNIGAPKNNALVSAILRGWSTENVFQARSAPPVDAYYSGFGALSSGFLTNPRPDVVTGQPFYLFGATYPGGKALNSNAFTAPPVDPATGLPSAQGNLPRNALRGFGAYQWDFAVHRDFPIHESNKLQFRAEMFNVLNHPNFGQPVGDLGFPGALTPQFGQSTQLLGQSLAGGSFATGGFAPLYQFGGPRSIQFALKLFF